MSYQQKIALRVNVPLFQCPGYSVISEPEDSRQQNVTHLPNRRISWITFQVGF